MKYCIPAFVLLIAISVVGCKNDRKTAEQLDIAEQLMSTRPDSSLGILNSIKKPRELNKKNYAFYGLLLTQALDKNYATPTSDSIIKYSVKYYEKTKDDQHKSLAFFYMSRVIKNSDKRDAITYLLKAEESALRINDYGLLGLIYYDLGMINDMQFVRISSVAYFRKAAENFKQAKNKVNEFYALNNLGWYFIQNNEYLSAYKELIKAKRIASQLDNNQLKLVVNNSIAYTYSCTDSLDKAKEMILRSIKNNPQTIYSTPEIYATLAYVYKRSNMLDSCIDLYQELLNVYKSINDTAKYAGIAVQISHAYKSKNDLKKAFHYLEIHQNLMNKTNDKINRNSIIEIEKHYKNEKIRAINQELTIANRNMWLLLTSSVLFAVLCLFLYFVVISEKNKKLLRSEIAKQQSEIKMQHMETKILEAKQILLSKLEIIKSINDINNIWEGDKAKFETKVQKLLDQYALNEESWDEISRIINQMNDGLYDRLRTKHSNLSTDDIRLACMIIVGLEVSEISPILGINNDSVFKKRKRLKKKLELTADVDLKKYLISIV